MRSDPPESLETTLENILDVVPTTVHLINPAPTVLKPFIYHAYTRETLPTTRIFASRETFDVVFEDFKTASKAAELANNHNIAFRTSTFTAPPTIVYDNTVVAIIQHYLLEDTKPQLASDIHEMVSNYWDDTTTYEFTTPPLQTIYESITTTFGSDVLLDVKSIFDAADTHHLTPATLTLLIGIRHDYTLAEVIAWAESLTLTTRGTISRHRQQLENANLIESTPTATETRGRPPMTLTPLADELTGDAATALQRITTIPP